VSKNKKQKKCSGKFNLMFTYTIINISTKLITTIALASIAINIINLNLNIRNLKQNTDKTISIDLLDKNNMNYIKKIL